MFPSKRRQAVSAFFTRFICRSLRRFIKTQNRVCANLRKWLTNCGLVVETQMNELYDEGRSRGIEGPVDWVQLEIDAKKMTKSGLELADRVEAA